MLIIEFVTGITDSFLTLIKSKVILTNGNEGGKALAPYMWVKTKRMTLIRFEKETYKVII